MPNRRGNRRGTAYSRAVTSTVRRLRLNAPDRWYSLRSKQWDPPQYKNAPVWTRKVRMEYEAPQAGSHVTYRDVATAMGIPTEGDKIFTAMYINRIDVWAMASQSSVTIRAYTQDSDNPDAEFSDYGVQGARRPHVSIALPLHAVRTVQLSSWTRRVVSFPEVSGKVVIDFHCAFWSGDFWDIIPSKTLSPSNVQSPPHSIPATTVPEMAENLSKITIL